MIVRDGNSPERVRDLGPSHGRIFGGSHSGVIASQGTPPKVKALEGMGHSHGDGGISKGRRTPRDAS